MIALDLLQMTGVLNISSIPETIGSILAGKLALQQMLSKKESEKLNRVCDLVDQIGASFDILAKAKYELPESISSQLRDCLSILAEMKEVVDEASGHGTWKKLRSKMNTNADYLDSLASELLHAIKVLRFAVSLSGYVQTQKQSPLTQLIADPIACAEWSSRFGQDVTYTPEFKDTLEFVSSFFHNHGETCPEFDQSCSKMGFFSWYRHDGGWSKCEACIMNLRQRITDEADSTKVKLHKFAKFCGDNLLLSIRDLIQSSHPSTSKFELVSPLLHLDEEVLQTSQMSAPISKAQEKALKYNRILFVGQSTQLADLHQMICRTLYSSVTKIDSVPDAQSFADWVDAHLKELKSCKGKVLILTDCERACCSSASSKLLAINVYEYLMMHELFTIGMGMLTCNFMSHGAEQIEEMKNLLMKGHFKNFSMSSDARNLTMYIENMFSPSAKVEFSSTENAAAAAAAAVTEVTSSSKPTKASKKSKTSKKDAFMLDECGEDMMAMLADDMAKGSAKTAPALLEHV